MLPIDLGYRPRPDQLRVHEQARRFTVVVAHRGFGKTRLATAALVDSALRGPERRLHYCAPYRNQARRLAWDYLRGDAALIAGSSIYEQDLRVTLPNQSTITLFGADNADAMRGLHPDGVVLDEAADQARNVWDAIVRPSLTLHHGWTMFIGTPRGVNWFSDLYTHAVERQSGGDPEWTAMMFRADETGVISPDELEKARRDTASEAVYRQEYLCDFQAAADNVLIPIDLVSECCAREVNPTSLQGRVKVIGVDVARFGDDSSVIQRRWGSAALEPIVLHGLDNMELAARVAHEIVEWSPDAVFVDAGRGEGVIDRLRSLGHAVIEINFGGKPADPRYANKRAEMWGLMAEWLRGGAAIPKHLRLRSDLSTPTYGFDQIGRIKIEAKDAIKARGMPSTDCGDALALTFAMPVAAQSTGPLGWYGRAKTRDSGDYDPFAETNT